MMSQTDELFFDYKRDERCFKKNILVCKTCQVAIANAIVHEWSWPFEIWCFDDGQVQNVVSLLISLTAHRPGSSVLVTDVACPHLRHSEEWKGSSGWRVFLQGDGGYDNWQYRGMILCSTSLRRAFVYWTLWICLADSKYNKIYSGISSSLSALLCAKNITSERLCQQLEISIFPTRKKCQYIMRHKY